MADIHLWMEENLVELRCFITVARAGSLTAAARLLGVSQPTVGRHIQAIESRFNRKLFDRTREGMFLNEAGKAIFEHAKGVDDALDAFQRRVSTSLDEMAGTVRLSGDEILLSSPAIAPPP